ncbi:MAG: hypothetical protein M3Y36_08875 [Actinomycetota bacterium]|nr:hypothetical protein [Actinomycetota bacterium]
MIVVAIFVVIALGLVTGTVAALHLGFRAGARLADAQLNRRIDAAATSRWEELGRLSHLP